MTREEANEYAKTMTYQDAIYNLMQAKGIPYRKATLAKINELLNELSRFELPPATADVRKCNECKYYEGVHKVMGHAPCSFHKIGGVLWDWYCSQWESL